MKMILKYFTSILFILGFVYIYGQDSSSEIWLNPETKDFKQIQQKANDYFADRDKGRGSGYKQWKRWEYLNESRLTTDGKITNHVLRNWNAWQEYLEMNNLPKEPDPADVTNGSWAFLAPVTYVTGAGGWSGGHGRINCIAFHPTDYQTIYVGTPAGGLWKTPNHGVSWTNLSDGLPSIGVSGIAINSSAPDVIYILTGDGDGRHTNSIGVLKSTNGGLSWWPTALSWGINDDVYGYKLRMHPTNNFTLYAVTSVGIYKTVNGGFSWNQVISGYFFDIEFNPGNPDIMYATKASSFYRSTDSGDSWNQITSGIPTNANRIEIGVTPENTNYVYLLCGPVTGDGTFRGVYCSDDNGFNFSLHSYSPNILGRNIIGSDSYDQSGYDLAIAVSTTNEAHLITGGVNTWMSPDYGQSWFITSWWKTTNNNIGYTH
ncbi:MAG: hypothetical protein K8R74_13080, partial [Bacteroidales bacterium]|nr:hypothetical protein [Bacteroidales bacterium]